VPAEAPGAPEGPLVLVVEDEVQVRRFLRAGLKGRGFRLVEAETGEQGIRMAAEYAPEVVLLDLGLPDMDGLAVLSRLREWSQVPVVVISARGKEASKVAALDAGADDYLTKPFGLPELLARLRVALRHAARGPGAEGGTEFRSGPLRLDLVARRVFVGKEEVHLTPIEYRMLALLARHAGRVVTQRQLLVEVWGPRCAEQTHYLRVHMTHLRRKVEPDPSKPRLLVTEAGVGYRLIEEDEG
jgi:two-component system KDP operon response regulator KdpE